MKTKNGFQSLNKTSNICYYKTHMSKLLFKERFVEELPEGRGDLVVAIEARLIGEKAPAEFPEGIKFRWIAYLDENPSMRVLMDCHSGKGPHIHVDDDPEGVPFVWTTLDDALVLFGSEIQKRFGVDIKAFKRGEK